MSLEVAINPNALRMVRDELAATINKASADFEAWVVDNSDPEPLRQSVAEMRQTGGTLRLLEMKGSAMLADQLSAVLAALADGSLQQSERVVNTLTQALFILPRYLEYVAIRQAELPLLVLPYVNELRGLIREPLIHEYECYQASLPLTGMMMTHGEPAQIDTLLATMPRFRHMYQAGLLKIMQSDRGAKAAFLLVSRPVERIARLLGEHPHAEIWQMAQAVIESMQYGHLTLNYTRKRLLAELEKLMRKMQTTGSEVLAGWPPETLKKELLFLLTLSSYQSPLMQSLQQAYQLPQNLKTDKKLAEERQLMQGPSLDTFESVIKVLQEELRQCKDILEVASQNASILAEDFTLLLETVKRVADTLGIINLTGPRTMLQDAMKAMETWRQQLNDVEPKQFLDAADAILYIESCLSGLDRRQLSVQQINEANMLTRKQIIASSQLSDAEQIVIEEAQAGIALAKRAITAYVDANFDNAHIANVATTLNTVRGGLNILGYTRAAGLLRHCSDFISSHIKQSGAADQRHQLLETLADALISLEYYLYELESNRRADDKVLDVAEESLRALGFSDPA